MPERVPARRLVPLECKVKDREEQASRVAEEQQRKADLVQKALGDLHDKLVDLQLQLAGQDVVHEPPVKGDGFRWRSQPSRFSRCDSLIEDTVVKTCVPVLKDLFDGSNRIQYKRVVGVLEHDLPELLTCAWKHWNSNKRGNGASVWTILSDTELHNIVRHHWNLPTSAGQEGGIVAPNASASESKLTGSTRNTPTCVSSDPDQREFLHSVKSDTTERTSVASDFAEPVNAMRHVSPSNLNTVDFDAPLDANMQSSFGTGFAGPYPPSHPDLENGTGTSVYTTNIFQQVKKQYNDGISVDFSSLRAQSPPCIDPMLTVLYHNNPSETSPSEDCATPEDW